jgi:hypothetical protein
MLHLLFAQAKPKNCPPDSTDTDCLSVLPQIGADSNQIQNILSIVFMVFAALAVVIIIMAAINLAGSEGNPENVSKAKKTIIFALVGLIIALTAEAMVLTLVGRL